MFLALIGLCVPNFWLGIMLILIFGVNLGLLPISGSGGILHLILPSITLSGFFLARNTRLVRSSLLEVIDQDYIRTARAKGLYESVVIFKHALRNAFIPVITIVGLEVARLIGGAVIVETIFAWPGVGRLVYQAVLAKDIPLIQGCVMILATSYVFFNFLVDISYAFLDPRIQYGEKKS